MSQQDYCHPYPLPSLFLLRAPSNRFATSIGNLCDFCYSAIDLLITATFLPHLYFRSFFYCFVGPFLLFLFSLRSKPTIKQLSIITMSGCYYTSSLFYSVSKIGPWSAIMSCRVMLFPVGLCRNVLSTRRFSKISWY
jgi:hypothetical protein